MEQRVSAGEEIPRQTRFILPKSRRRPPYRIFTGFGTVVICGSGTLRIDGAGIGQTYGKTMMESCEIGTRLAASVITTGENVCPRYLPSEFGLDVSAPDDAQLALEL